MVKICFIDVCPDWILEIYALNHIKTIKSFSDQYERGYFQKKKKKLSLDWTSNLVWVKFVVSKLYSDSVLYHMRWM